jgi:hypothetical protein
VHLPLLHLTTSSIMLHSALPASSLWILDTAYAGFCVKIGAAVWCWWLHGCPAVADLSKHWTLTLNVVQLQARSITDACSAAHHMQCAPSWATLQCYASNIFICVVHHQ